MKYRYFVLFKKHFRYEIQKEITHKFSSRPLLPEDFYNICKKIVKDSEKNGDDEVCTHVKILNISCIETSENLKESKFDLKWR